jgi:excisionase family DNA binding protein
MERHYNITAAAKLLGVTRETVYRWEKEGRLKFVKIGDFNKVPESELLKMVKTKKED